jgi:hypothetical protein
LRPQDVLIVLKLHLVTDTPWTLSQVAEPLGISASEVHGAVQRLNLAGLYSAERRAVRARNVVEFLVHGVKYWLPIQLGSQSRGVPTADYGPPLRDLLSPASSEGSGAFVWPHEDGEAIGQAIFPLYPTIPDAARGDPALHELLALVEVLRLGRLRQQSMAIKELRRRLEVL